MNPPLQGLSNPSAVPTCTCLFSVVGMVNCLKNRPLFDPEKRSDTRTCTAVRGHLFYPNMQVKSPT